MFEKRFYVEGLAHASYLIGDSGQAAVVDPKRDVDDYLETAEQEKLKYNRTSGVKLGPVDPVKYAEAFGATGLQIQHPDEIAPTLRKAFDTPGPVLIGVHVDYRYSVKLFEQVHEGSTV